MAEVGVALRADQDVDPGRVARAAFQLLERHVTTGEVQGGKHLLPAGLLDLWH